MKTPDFSDAQVGDKVYFQLSDGWIEGIVTRNRGDNIRVRFDRLPFWYPTFDYDGTETGNVRVGLFWQPLPDPPEECLRRPSHGK